jgi:hypothetical protein
VKAIAPTMATTRSTIAPAITARVCLFNAVVLSLDQVTLTNS